MFGQDEYRHDVYRVKFFIDNKWKSYLEECGLSKLSTKIIINHPVSLLNRDDAVKFAKKIMKKHEIKKAKVFKVVESFECDVML